METKHTPGPWRIDVNGSDKWSVDYDGPSSTYMTICGERKEPIGFAVEPDAFGDDAELEANARLFAAAPCLLDAAQRLLTSINEMDPEQRGCSTVAYAELYDAIAKATGAA